MRKPRLGEVAESPVLLPIYLPHSEHLARRAFLNNGPRTAFFEFHTRAELGSSAAQATVALMYLFNWVADSDSLGCAKYWATKSAASGDEYGQWVFSWVLLEEQRLAPGIQQMLLSAEQRFTPAIHHLGLFLANGVGFSKDITLGMKLVQMAARMGHHASKIFMMQYYKTGRAGLLNQIVFMRAWQVGEFFDPIVRILPGKLFGPSRLIYYRQVIVENAIRRDMQGETIGHELENKIQDLLDK